MSFGNTLGNATLAILIWVVGAVYADEPQKANAPNATQKQGAAPEQAPDKKVNGDNDDKEDPEALINQLFAQVDALVAGKDKRSLKIAELQDSLKQKFKALESQRRTLKAAPDWDADEDRNLRKKQLLAAQQINELTRRATMGVDPHHGVRKITRLFQDFKKEHPKLAAAQQVRIAKKRHESLMQAMNARNVDLQHVRSVTLQSKLDELSEEKWYEPKPSPVHNHHPGEFDGAIQRGRAALQMLLKLRWNGEAIHLDRHHWTKPFAGISSEEVADSVDRLLVDVEHDERHHIQLPRSTSFESRIFGEFQASQLEVNQYGSTGNQARFSGVELEARFVSEEDLFSLMIHEKQGARRLLKFTQDAEELEILLLGDAVIRFSQKADGPVHVVEIFNDEVVSHRAESFAKLYVDQPEFVERRFFAMLDHLGFLLPLSRYHPVVIDRVIERLTSDQESHQRKAETLIAALGSSEFNEREAAFEELGKNVDLYHEAIMTAKSDPLTSTEVKAQIARLAVKCDQRPGADTDNAISSMRLLDNEAYLAELNKTITDPHAKEVLTKRLQTIAR